MHYVPARLYKAAAIWWPDWLYESMPLVYAAAGILAIIHFESPEGYAAGALLLLAAVVILKMRRDYRNLKSTIRLARELIDMTQDTRRQTAPRQFP